MSRKRKGSRTSFILPSSSSFPSCRVCVNCSRQRKGILICIKNETKEDPSFHDQGFYIFQNFILLRHLFRVKEFDRDRKEMNCSVLWIDFEIRWSLPSLSRILWWQMTWPSLFEFHFFSSFFLNFSDQLVPSFPIERWEKKKCSKITKEPLKRCFFRAWRGFSNLSQRLRLILLICSYCYSVKILFSFMVMDRFDVSQIRFWL